MLAIEARDDPIRPRVAFGWLRVSTHSMPSAGSLISRTKLFYSHRMTNNHVSVYLFLSRAEWAKKGGGSIGLS